MDFDDEALQALLDADPRQTTRELAEQFNCSYTTVERHLHALGKVHKYGYLVPHQWSTDNLVQRASICASLLFRQKLSHFWNEWSVEMKNGYVMSTSVVEGSGLILIKSHCRM